MQRQTVLPLPAGEGRGEGERADNPLPSFAIKVSTGPQAVRAPVYWPTLFVACEGIVMFKNAARLAISIGKPGSLMPAFAQAQGGPLTDLQIANLAAFLNMTIPSHNRL